MIIERVIKRMDVDDAFRFFYGRRRCIISMPDPDEWDAPYWGPEARNGVAESRTDTMEDAEQFTVELALDILSEENAFMNEHYCDMNIEVIAEDEFEVLSQWRLNELTAGRREEFHNYRCLVFDPTPGNDFQHGGWWLGPGQGRTVQRRMATIWDFEAAVNSIGNEAVIHILDPDAHPNPRLNNPLVDPATTYWRTLENINPYPDTGGTPGPTPQAAPQTIGRNGRLEVVFRAALPIPRSSFERYINEYGPMMLLQEQSFGIGPRAGFWDTGGGSRADWDETNPELDIRFVREEEFRSGNWWDLRSRNLYWVREPLPAGQTCRLESVLTPQVINLIRLSPTNETARAQVLAHTLVPIPDEHVTFDAIKDWIEHNVTPRRLARRDETGPQAAVPTPVPGVAPGGVDVYVWTEQVRTGRASYTYTRGRTTNIRLTAATIREVAEQAMNDDSNADEFISALKEYIVEAAEENEPELTSEHDQGDTEYDGDHDDDDDQDPANSRVAQDGHFERAVWTWMQIHMPRAYSAIHDGEDPDAEHDRLDEQGDPDDVAF